MSVGDKNSGGDNATIQIVVTVGYVLTFMLKISPQLRKEILLAQTIYVINFYMCEGNVSNIT